MHESRDAHHRKLFGDSRVFIIIVLVLYLFFLKVFTHKHIVNLYDYVYYDFWSNFLFFSSCLTSALPTHSIYRFICSIIFTFLFLVIISIRFDFSILTKLLNFQ